MKMKYSHRRSHQPNWLNTLFLLIAFFNLLFLLWSGWMNWQVPYDGAILSDEDRVESVAPNSPAERAGIRPGDVILAINGQSLKELHSPYEGLHAGDESIYSVIRDSELRVVSVGLEPLPLRSRILDEEPIFVGLIFWLVSLFVWMATPATKISQIFFLLGQTATVMLATGAISTFKRNSLENCLFTISLLILSPLVAHFYLTFPQPRESRYRRLYLGTIYGIASILIVTYAIISRTQFQNQWLQFISSQKLNFVIIVLVAALVSLFSPRVGATIHSRRQQRLLIAGMLLSVLPILTLSVLPQVITGQPYVSYLWTFPFLVLLPVSYAYAVQVENLDKFDRLLKHVISLLVLGAVFSGLYFSVFGILHSLDFPSRRCHLAAGSVMLLTAILTTPALMHKIDLVLDRFFYGHWYDYRSIIQQNSRNLSGMIRFDELAQSLLQNARTMRFKKAILFKAKDGVLIPYKYFGYPSTIAETLTQDINSLIIQRLRAAGKPVRFSDLISPDELTAAPTESLHLLTDANIRVLLPLLTKQKELLGVLALGERQAYESLDSNDWAILTTLTDQTSLAAENIYLVETLREQVQVMEQIQQELKETKWRLAENRERERLELAQILHDGPIQDIYSIIYQLAIWRKLHDEEADPELRELEVELMAVEKRLRHISTELRPPALDSFGLEGALRSHITKLKETNPDLEILPDLISTKKLISAEEKLGLFRIYQEAVQNAIRHARPSKIWIRLYQEGNQLILEIEDNGHGFEVPAKWMDFARKGHLGILGITERAEAIGGQLEVRSKSGEGTIIRVRIAVHGE
jgi:signal transduction histidine kinase